MKFASEDEAKGYAVGKTAGHLRLDQIRDRLKDYQSYIESAFTEDRKQSLEKEKLELEEWVNSDQYKNGEYSQGIDELILELIEWRASIYAFQNVDTQNAPFSEHAFYAQWLMGGTYTVLCLLGKLVSKDSRDNSLRKLWDEVSGYVTDNGLCGDGEIDAISKKMHRTEGHFTNSNSPAMFYRNTVIAHNERFPSVEWSDIDKDIELICRLWALITMWSSFGLLNPFRDSRVAFSGLGSVFSIDEIEQLQDQRKDYLDKVKKWCSHDIASGKKVSDRLPFGRINVSVTCRPVGEKEGGLA